jgi:hypothetical protein
MIQTRVTKSYISKFQIARIVWVITEYTPRAVTGRKTLAMAIYA